MYVGISGATYVIDKVVSSDGRTCEVYQCATLDMPGYVLIISLEEISGPQVDNEARVAGSKREPRYYPLATHAGEAEFFETRIYD
jgi:hypothetical protein